MKIRALFLLAVTAMLAFASVAARADVTQEVDDYPYQGATGDDLVLDCTGSGIGGVCPPIPVENLISAQALIIDQTGLPTGGYWEWVDQVDIANGNDLGHGSFCGDTGVLTPPEGAAALVIFIDEVLGPTDCLVSVGPPPAVRPEVSPGVGTTGVVRIGWTYDDTSV